MLRGYYILKRSGSLWKLNNINEDLSITRTIENNKGFSKLLFGNSVHDIELVIRQFILKNFCGVRLNKKILYYKGIDKPLIYPLPYSWLKIIKKNDFKVDINKSTILWYFFVLAFLLFGIFSILKTLIVNLKSIFYPHDMKKNYIYFDSLSSSNIPKKRTLKNEFTIINWYLQSHLRDSNIEAIYHTAKTDSTVLKGGILLASISSVILPLSNFRSFMEYFVWSILAVLKALLDFIFGKWWSALLLNEALKRKVVSLHPYNNLAKEYFFHNSNWIYRPLWTYEAEKLGSLITFYFYSTNIMPLKKNAKPAYGYNVMSWPKYLVWDIHQENFIRNCVNANKIDQVGPIWFSDSTTKLKSINSKLIIAIFDVQPVRDSFYKVLGIDYDYYTVKNISQFILDILDLFDSKDCIVVLKRKRDIGKLSHISYRNLIKKLSSNPKFKIEDSNVSARLLIEKSNLVISMPYTSTAIIAKELGKPSVYYDPTNKLFYDTSKSHGIELLLGKKSLNKWIIENSNL